MGNNLRFESIYIEHSKKNRHIIDINSKNIDYNYDCHDTCIIRNSLDIYIIPDYLTDDQWGEVYDGNSTNLVKAGEINGYLLLCKEMVLMGEDPWEICDDMSGDLEYVISALQDKNGPLNDIDGDLTQDIYYIDEFQMLPEFCHDLHLQLKNTIINELPNLIFVFLHVRPELLAYYPIPMEYIPDSNRQERNWTLNLIAMQKKERIFKNKGQKDSTNILNFADAYQFTEDEINMLMGRRYSGSSYPEDAKDLKEYKFYQDNGFVEAGDSRLLYKYVE